MKRTRRQMRPSKSGIEVKREMLQTGPNSKIQPTQGRRTILFLSFLCLFFCLIATVYADQYGLTINVVPQDGGTVKADCTTPCLYDPNVWAHLLAIPQSGYIFDNWSVDCAGNNPSVRVMMTEPKTCNANFSFCADLPVKRGGYLFDTFWYPYASQMDDNTISMLATNLKETLRFDNPQLSIILKGGHACGYVSNPSFTLIQGQMIFETGSASVENIMILSGTPPVITSFAANPPSILSGGSSTLQWTVADATEVSIDKGIGPVDPIMGSLMVTPVSTTIYKMTATNDYGSDTAQVTVNVQSIKISTFSATPDVIASGGISILTWSASGATSVVIDQGIGEVDPTSGSVPVSPATTTVYTITATNADGTVTKKITVGVIPPDPVASAIDQTVATSLQSATEFLYTGLNPIQTGMAPEAIDAKRVAVLRGKVMDRDNSALSGVTITILNHPEFGQTITRDDGMFDIAVNGGGYLTINYRKTGYLSAQRQVNVPWQDYASAPDVVFVPVDTQVTTVDLNSTAPIQVAQSSIVSDNLGNRQATLFIPQGTQAEIVMPDGSTQPITTISVRATEYTVGPNGPKAMPAELPPNSGYTYCVDLSADEISGLGAEGVSFDRPLVTYLENFLHAKVGDSIPLGYYDRGNGQWVAAESGRVVKILSIIGEMAELDIDGTGVAADLNALAALGITDAERTKLASLYNEGQELWRMPILHFSAWDANWGFSPPDDSTYPDQDPPKSDTGENDPCEQSGSVIECQNQVLGERVPVAGTSFTLNYRSSRTLGRKAANTLQIPLSGATVPESLVGIELEISVAGRTFAESFSRNHSCLSETPNLGNLGAMARMAITAQDLVDLTNLSYTFNWDGKDAYGRSLQGEQPVTIRIGYTYCGQYQYTNRFGYNGGGLITGSRTRQQLTLWQVRYTVIRPWDSRGQGLGGWSLDVHHVYNPFQQITYLGNGAWIGGTIFGKTITTYAGDGGSWSYDIGDGGPATQAALGQPDDIAVGPDGSVFVTDNNHYRIRKITPDGIIHTVAGNGGYGYTGDGGPAVQAQIGNFIDALAVGPDGSIYFSSGSHYVIRKVTPDGIIHTVAGNGTSGFSGDGGPATQAMISVAVYGLAVGSDGNLFIADSFNNRIRRVGPDGIITTIAGTGAYGTAGIGGPATEAEFWEPNGVAIGPDGSLFIADSGNLRICKVTPDGTIKRIAGWGWDLAYEGDGGLASAARLFDPQGVAVAKDGTVYIADSGNNAVRMIDTNNIINTMAGKKCDNYPYCLGVARFSGDGGPATNAEIAFRTWEQGLRMRGGKVALATDGTLYLADKLNNRIRRVGLELHGQVYGSVAVVSRDGGEIYLFDNAGHHLRTVNALTGEMIYEFRYDSSWRLIQIKDGSNNITTVERDASGNPTAIVSPYGQRSTLALDVNGYLSGITNPASETTSFQYTSDGLMTKMTTPRGHDYIYTYDSLGRLTKDEDPAGGSQSLARTELSEGYEVTKTTALGRSTTYSVENLSTGDSQMTNTSPDGTQTTALLKTDGTQIITAPDGTVTTVQEGPDPRFGMQSPILKSFSIQTPGGITLTTATSRSASLSNPNDPLSFVSLTDTTNMNGRIYTSYFDGATKTRTSTSPAGRQVLRTIDSLGRIVKREVSGINPVFFAYDGHGRLSAKTTGADTDERTFTFSYNAEGYLSAITDPLSQVMSFSYDSAGRLIENTLPDGRVISYTYDGNGNVTSVTPPGKPVHSLSFNAIDMLEQYTPPLVGAGTNVTTYEYDLDRKVTAINRPDGQNVSLAYTPGGKLQTKTTPAGTYSYTYDPTTGQLSSINAPGGQSLSYGYDGNIVPSEVWSGPVTGRVDRTANNDRLWATMSVNSGDPISFGYDTDGILIQAGSMTITRSTQNRLVTGTTIDSVHDTWSYNAFGEVAGYTASFGATPLISFQYTRDKLGRITQKAETLGGATDTYSYTYDLAGRLTTVAKNAATVESYGYDSNSNRISATTQSGTVNGTYDDQDRLLQYGTENYTYTANGELLSRTNGSQTTAYQYDVLGNLLGVMLPDGTQITYIVDGQNRRVGKKVNNVLTNRLLYKDGISPIAELDGSGAVSLFVYGTGNILPDYMVKGGVAYRIISDQLGSARLVVNAATGAIAQRMDYDAFGGVTLDTNPGFQPFGFAGGLYDTHTRLTRFGVRDYDAQIGRWTAKDPIRFQGQDTNLYGYVRNDPQNNVDWSGLVTDCIVRFATEDNEPKTSYYTEEQCRSKCKEKRKERDQRHKNYCGKMDWDNYIFDEVDNQCLDWCMGTPWTTVPRERSWLMCIWATLSELVGSDNKFERRTDNAANIRG